MNERFDIGLLDLGFSNFQVMDDERGFSYLPNSDEAYLDMRFDNSPDSPLGRHHLQATNQRAAD